MSEKIIKLVENIISAFNGKLPETNIIDARDLLYHDEWGEALSIICDQLYEYDIGVCEEDYRMIEAAGMKMGLDSEMWKRLTVTE